MPLDQHNYEQYGFKSAMESDCDPKALTGYLDGIYTHFTAEADLSPAEIEQLKSKLDSEMNIESQKKVHLLENIQTINQAIDSINVVLEPLELEKFDHLNQKNVRLKNSHALPFFIGSFILILLTFYLFLFYSSTGYSALYGVKDSTSGLVNPDLFSEAKTKGGGALGLILLFPIIFFAVGFLLHIILDKNKKLKQQNQREHFGRLIFIILTALIADIFIGYKIAQGIHTNAYYHGDTNLAWQSGMIFTDINFYFVLILGFAVYIIWGFLLHYVISHPYLSSLSTKREVDTAALQLKREERDMLADRLGQLEKNLEVCESNLILKRGLLTQLNQGKIPATIHTYLLRSIYDLFMTGYKNYAKNALPLSPTKPVILAKIETVGLEWIFEKTRTLEAN